VNEREQVNHLISLKMNQQIVCTELNLCWHMNCKNVELLPWLFVCNLSKLLLYTPHHNMSTKTCLQFIIVQTKDKWDDFAPLNHSKNLGQNIFTMQILHLKSYSRQIWPKSQLHIQLLNHRYTLETSHPCSESELISKLQYLLLLKRNGWHFFGI
jgi:hypothetical protein